MGWAGGAGDQNRPHSPWLRTPGSLWSAQTGPLPTDGFAGPAMCETSWESQPGAFHWKAVPANWAPPRQGWGVNVPKRLGAKCGEGPEEGLDVFQCSVAWFPPAHLVMDGALVLTTYPLLILTPHTASKHLRKRIQKLWYRKTPGQGLTLRNSWVFPTPSGPYGPRRI